MSPSVHIEHTYEDDDGVEHDAALDADVSEPTRGTYWDPPYPGHIEAVTLYIDGVEISDLTGWQWLIDEMLTKPIPKPDDNN